MANGSVDDYLVTSPSPSGERRGIPRNIHWILLGILGIGLSIVVLRSAVDKERRAAEVKQASELRDLKGKAQIDKKTDPLSIMSIQNDQEAQIPAKETLEQPVIGKLPPVPKDAKPAGLYPPEDQNRDAKELAKKQAQRDEAIASSQILALKGKNGGASKLVANAVGDITDAGGASQPGVEFDRLRKQRTAAASNQNYLSGRQDDLALIGGAGNGGGMSGRVNPFTGQPSRGASGSPGQASSDMQWAQNQGLTASTPVLRVNQPASQTVVMQGTVIPVVLLTQINSDMPGQISALVTTDVYDSIRGTSLIIPRGSKLFGEYNSQVRVGQERALAAFTRLIRPDGTYVNLLGMNAADAKGQSGLEGEVNNHFLKMFGASFLTAGLSFLFDRNKTQTVVVTGGGSTGSLSGATGDILVDISKRAGQRNQNIPPTITVPAGEKFFVVVNKDIDIPPYRANLPGQ